MCNFHRRQVLATGGRDLSLRDTGRKRDFFNRLNIRDLHLSTADILSQVILCWEDHPKNCKMCRASLVWTPWTLGTIPGYTVVTLWIPAVTPGYTAVTPWTPGAIPGYTVVITKICPRHPQLSLGRQNFPPRLYYNMENLKIQLLEN